ncbi:MAG: LamG domain-containing protein, partial [Solirubrobacteraceae bacterium]|nr:LamG domain-containing protein [Solirubrobacteraceae bacterium]
MVCRFLAPCVLALSLPAPAALAAPPLIAQYHLDANDGADSSGNAIDGTPGAGATVTAGKFGGAVRAGGAASLIVPETSPKIGSLRPARTTVLLWVKQSGDPGFLRYLVSAGGQGPGACLGSPFALYTGYSGIPGGPGAYFYVRGTDGQTHVSNSSGASLYDGQWHMLAGTFDGRHTRLYLDGAEVGTAADEPTEINYAIATDGSFRIGQYSAPACGAALFPGDIDEVRVYDRALTATEIGRLAAAPGPNPPDLVPDA